MEDFVDDLRREDLDVLPVLLAEGPQPRPGPLQLGPQDRLRLLPQGDDRGDHLEGVVPLGELQDLLADDALGLLGLPEAVAHVLVDHPLQIVNVEEVDVVDPAHLGVHVARHGNVDEEEQAVLAAPERPLDHRGGEDVARGARGADDDIGLLELLLQELEAHGDPVDLLGHLHGPRVGSVGHDDPPRPVREQVPGGKLGHLARPHQQDRPALQAPQDLLGHLHGGEAHRDGVAGDGRLRPHALGRAEGVVEQLVEDDPRGLLLHAVPVGLLDLPQDLGLAHHHGVQARGHPEEMTYGLAAAVDVEALLQLGGVEVSVPQE